MNPYEIEVIHGQLNTISQVFDNSLAQEVGLEVGDQILSINGTKILDIIDYRYNISESYIELLIQKSNGELWELEIEKDLDEDLGISFVDPLLDRQKTCSNNCIFCFIDQMPKGMRESLYIKDDDSRLSFLQGNYITLTNLKDDDIDRIIQYKLSPINVSVHTTNPSLRIQMLKNKFAGKILNDLKKLTDNKIEINAQIVAIPGINDGFELEKTLEDLYQLGNSIHSVAVVPVGITKYRTNLNHLNIYDKKSANKLIELVENFGKKVKRTRTKNWVYASDEFYLIAERELPNEEYYDGYPQYENGVGLLRSFYEEAVYFIEQIKENQESGSVTIATGEYAYSLLKVIIYKLNQKLPNFKISLYKIVNDFFGDTVKVAGLLTGRDIIEQLKGLCYDDIMLPRVMFRQDKLITLDDLSIENIEEELNCRIIPCENDGQIFIEKIMEVGLHG